MPSKYIDTTSCVQVIGTVFQNPSLLDMADKYQITDEDFTEDLHKVVMGAIFKIHENGVEKITIENINDYLSTKPKSNAIYQANKGDEWLKNVIVQAIPTAFDFYYNRMKKMSLLRAYDKCGIDVSWIYDPNQLDTKKLQLQEEQLENMSLLQIADQVDAIVDKVRQDYTGNEYAEEYQAGDSIEELIARLQTYPEVGVPLYGRFINRITRGARLKKFYLRSAPSGAGKTRSLIADCCTIGTDTIYDDMLGWIGNGIAEPCLFISTELELEEVQTMMLAFLAHVEEDHILNNSYMGDELDRVMKAAKIIKESPIYVEIIPDFSIQDIENTIKKHIRQHEVHYVIYDYIHSSMKILEEVSRKSGGVKLREDNVLFMLSIKLKDICNQYGVFIKSATQLNGDWKDAEMPDQNLLRGSKAIADKIDYGDIILPIMPRDLDGLDAVLKNGKFQRPDCKISVYKNRRGQYKGIYLWCKNDLGTCRIDPMFVTDWNYQLIDMEDFKIHVEKSAF